MPRDGTGRPLRRHKRLETEATISRVKATRNGQREVGPASLNQRAALDQRLGRQVGAA